MQPVFIEPETAANYVQRHNGLGRMKLSSYSNSIDFCWPIEIMVVSFSPSLLRVKSL